MFFARFLEIIFLLKVLSLVYFYTKVSVWSDLTEESERHIIAWTLKMLFYDVSLDCIFDYLKEIKRVFITVWMCVFFYPHFTCVVNWQRTRCNTYVDNYFYRVFWPNVFRPDITAVIDWALKINTLSVACCCCLVLLCMLCMLNAGCFRVREDGWLFLGDLPMPCVSLGRILFSCCCCCCW